jgi:crotonobetainyl-CoA:carnitine CoA-transferase CaiB-like acyl-CoA transferase
VLAELRVLDCSDESGFLAGKILGDLGADVVKVEPPGGDRDGRRPPYLAGVVDPERSLSWLALNTSKRGITLDLERAAGRSAFRRLLAWADVLLDTFAPGTLDAWGFGWDTLHAEHPRLVRCAITPFGQTGPHAPFRARDLVVVAMGGNAAMTGDSDRPPLRCTMPTAYYHAAPEAVLGILMALHARAASGRGQQVDVSLQETQLSTLLGGPGIHGNVVPPPRRCGARTGGTRDVWPAGDGHVSFDLRGGAARVPALGALVAWMSETGDAPEWLRSQAWEHFDPNALDAAALDRLEAAFGAFFAARSMRELYAGALARRIPLAPCNDAREVLAQPQLRDRALFTTIEYPELGAAVEHPAFFAKASRAEIGLRRRAPRIGEDNDAVYREAGFTREEIEKLAAEGAL